LDFKHISTRRKHAQPMTDIDLDQKLMLAAAQGDTDSFGELVRRHQGAVINYFFRYTQNIETARELSQDVFLRIYEARRRYRPTAKFTTYLFRVAHNLAINKVIAKKRPVSVPMETDDPDTYDPVIASEDDTPEQAALASEESRFIEDALSTLTERERSVLIMKYTLDMSYAEIAGATGDSESAVDSLLMRAKRKLKRELGKRDVTVPVENA